MYRVSIVTPSFNQAQYIEKTIESVLQQSEIELEYIIIDGASTDGSVERIRKYELDPRIHWVSEPDSGPASAINKGWEKSSGDYLCWINSDDYYLDASSIVSQVRFLEENNADLVFGDSVYVSIDGERIQPLNGSRYSRDKLLTFSIPAQPTLVMRKSVFEQVGKLNETLACVFDSEYWLRASDRGCKFAYNPKLIAAYRIHPHSITVSADDKMYREKLSLISRFTQNGNQSRILSAKVALAEATISLDRRKYRRAIRLFIDSIHFALIFRQTLWAPAFLLSFIGLSQPIRNWLRHIRRRRAM